MKMQLQKHSSDCLRCQIKGNTKRTTGLVKVQSVLCEVAGCLKKVFLVCLVIVSVYDKGINREITNKVIVVVYIKL